MSAPRSATAATVSPAPETDIAIVGGGLSGSLAAVILGRAGYRVTLIDLHERHPAEFRVEKIAGDQVAALQRLGLLDALSTVATGFHDILNVRNGKVVDRTHAPHFGILYGDLVDFVRAQVPPSVRFVLGRVADLKVGPNSQQVVLGDDERINARLVVLATGLGDALRSKLGIKRRVVVEKQSFSFGFNISSAMLGAHSIPALTYYGEDVSARIDYLNIFPVGELMRANLFTFCDHRDPWIRELRQDPTAALLKALPGLKSVLPDLEVTSPVQNWLMDLSVAENCRQAGVVLIGDAFQTSCPAAGTGVSRLLTDIEQLCLHHVPGWLATPGMGAEKIAAFYDDPVKQAMDARALRLAGYRRSLTIERGLGWQLHRRVTFARRRLLGLLDQHLPGVAVRLRALRA